MFLGHETKSADVIAPIAICGQRSVRIGQDTAEGVVEYVS